MFETQLRMIVSGGRCPAPVAPAPHSGLNPARASSSAGSQAREPSATAQLPDSGQGFSDQ